MKTLVIILTVIIALAAIIIFRVRASSSQRADKLQTYLSQGRDYIVFIGVPLESPTRWEQAEVDGDVLAVSGSKIHKEDVKSYIVAYLNGQMLHSENLFYPVPANITGLIESSKPKVDILDIEELKQGSARVHVSHGSSGAHNTDPHHYSTKIENVSDQKVSVTKFAAFAKSGGQFILNTVSGDYFSAEEFINWYGTQPDGWIAPGSSVEDPNNYGGGDGYWVYYFELETGEIFLAGAKIP